MGMFGVPARIPSGERAIERTRLEEEEKLLRECQQAEALKKKMRREAMKKELRSKTKTELLSILMYYFDEEPCVLEGYFWRKAWDKENPKGNK